jgi:NodT family efflux transporter outer membrane factor (OMF) lipoprotein
MDSVKGRVGLLAVGAVLLAGCKVGPDYETPDVAVPENWNATASSVPTTQPAAAAVTQWWTTFNDPVLNELVGDAVRANLDLRIAAARLREARALRRVAGSGLFPMLDATGSYQRSRQSENLEGFDVGVDGGHGGVGGVPQFNLGEEMDLYQAGFDASWELDVFGGVRRSIEAADADVQAAIEDARDVYVTLLAELARNYVDLRGLQRQLVIARQNLGSQEETLELTRARFNAGLVGELDVARARTQVKTTESVIPALEVQVLAAAHRIEVLRGLHPGALSEVLLVEAPLPAVPPAVPVALPSDLLRRRPDIRRAERQLAAATARVGVATAELFPRFSLTGSFGFQSSDASDLADSDSRAWSVGPAVRLPLFDRGRIRANVVAENARQQAALAAYERAILVALEDVENALIAHAKELQRRQALAEAVEAARRSVALATELYSRGLTDFLAVLEAQRSQFEVEDRLAESDRLVAANVVGLYKALGGGWECSPDGEGR